MILSEAHEISPHDPMCRTSPTIRMLRHRVPSSWHSQLRLVVDHGLCGADQAGFGMIS